MGMNLDVFTFATKLWQQKPAVIILFVAGFIVFFLVIADAHRHSRKRNLRPRKSYRRSLLEFHSQLLPRGGRLSPVKTKHAKKRWGGERQLPDPAFHAAAK